MTALGGCVWEVLVPSVRNVIERLEVLERKKTKEDALGFAHPLDEPEEHITFATKDDLAKEHTDLAMTFATKDDLAKEHTDLATIVQSVEENLRDEVRTLKEQVQTLKQRSEAVRSASFEEPVPVAAPVPEAVMGTPENTDLEKDVRVLQIRASAASLVLQKTVYCGYKILGAMDRFGVPDRPKQYPGGIFTIVFFVTILIYTVIVYFQSQDRPLVQHSDVKWSNNNGPYPFPTTCFFERCWVSLTYDAAASGQAGGCVKKIPAEQRGKCFELKAKETIKLEMCYSQLPGQGVRMQYGGAPKWGDKALDLGITNATSTNYGLASISHMEGATEKMPVMDFLTPLREGVVSAMYVRTDNKSQPVTSAGRVRHEWFSLSLNPVAAATDFATDPCIPNIQGWESATSKKIVGRTMIVMQPNYQHIRVTNPESFHTFLLGSVGGAIAIADIVFIWLLERFYTLQRKMKVNK